MHERQHGEGYWRRFNDLVLTTLCGLEAIMFRTILMHVIVPVWHKVAAAAFGKGKKNKN